MEGFFAVLVIIIFTLVTVARKTAAGKRNGASSKTPEISADMLKAAEQAFEAAENANAANSDSFPKENRNGYDINNGHNGDDGYYEADGKPYYVHSTDECTGGSIHDGYHEGSRKRQTAGTEGKKVKNGGENREAYILNAAPEGRSAEKSAFGFAEKFSPAARAVVLAEIIGKPKSL